MGRKDWRVINIPMAVSNRIEKFIEDEVLLYATLNQFVAVTLIEAIEKIEARLAALDNRNEEKK